MPITSDSFDDDSRLDPLDGDIDDDDGDVTVPCPSCGREIYEDADQCPQCGEWIVAGGQGSIRGRGIWTIAAVLALLAILLISIL